MDSSIKSKLKKIAGSGSTKKVIEDIGILASGSIISKILGFGAYPIITRIYTPEDFGIMAVFTSAIFIIHPFGTLTYSVTIPLPKSDGMAINILILGIVITIIITLLISIILILVGNEIFTFLNASEIFSYWWLLILGIISASVFDLLIQWATRIKSFSIVAKAHIWQAIFSITTQIGLGLLGLKPIGLLLGEVVRKSGGMTILYRKFRIEFINSMVHVSVKRMLFVFKYYRDLPFFHLPSQLISILTLKIPLLFFAFQYGTETAGQLGLAFMVIGIPMGILGRNTANAYYSEIAKIGMNQKKEIYNLTVSLIKRLAVLSSFPTIILIFLSPLLFKYIFGSEWFQAGQFTSIIAFYLYFEFLATPFMKIFNVFNTQRIYLQISFVRIMLIIVVFTLAYSWNIDIYNALIAYTFIMVLHYLYTINRIYKIIK